jgi:hypothetical protein
VGKGITGETMMDAYNRVVAWARDGRLTFGIDRVRVSRIETAWQRTDLKGKRLVVVPQQRDGADRSRRRRRWGPEVLYDRHAGRVDQARR